MARYNKKKKTDHTPERSPRMISAEDDFLRFATALKIFVGRWIRLDRLPRIKSLLQEYLLAYREIYGKNDLKPNHHWAVHIPDQLTDYGPVYNFGAFLTERLNKPLKNLNSNNWTGGALEVSMMREFHCNAAVDSAHLQMFIKLHQMLSTPARSPSLEMELRFIQILVGQDSNAEALGTVQVATHTKLTLSRVKLGRVINKMNRIDDTIRLGLFRYYNKDDPKVHYNTREQDQFDNSSTLIPYADIYDYASLDGRRITPTSRSTRNKAGSSITQARFGSDDVCMGEMIESGDTPRGENSFIWHKFPELGINTWECNEFEDPTQPDARPLVITSSDVHCQVSRVVMFWLWLGLKAMALAFQNPRPGHMALAWLKLALA
ncbi:hypothetical protein FB451DRAFT_1364546 [Mycena latifolia]|nr:hypothetical protein FB451DRAFT_1364546 [Mycena latifolia]